MNLYDEICFELQSAGLMVFNARSVIDRSGGDQMLSDFAHEVAVDGWRRVGAASALIDQWRDRMLDMIEQSGRIRPDARSRTPGQAEG